MHFAKKLSIFAVIFLALAFFPSIVDASSGTGRQEDGFDTTFWGFAQSGTDTINCSVEVMTDMRNATEIKYGSFDDALDTEFEEGADVVETNRNPIKVRLSATLNHVQEGAGGSCSVTISINSSCDNLLFNTVPHNIDYAFGATVDLGDTGYNMTFEANGTTGQYFGQTTGTTNSYGSEYIMNTDYVGERCVRLTATESQVGSGSSTDTSFRKIGIAPRINGSRVQSKANYFQNQSVFHGIKSNLTGELRWDGSVNAIQNLTLQLINASNNATLLPSTNDTTPATNFSQQLISFNPNPSPNTNLKYVYVAWADNGTTHARFSSLSDNTDNGTRPMTPTFNLTDFITCDQYNNLQYNLFNRGEPIPAQGRVVDWNSVPFNETNGVTNEVNYTVGGISQFGNISFTLNGTGGWQRNTTITSSANATTDFIGQPTNATLWTYNSNDRTENMSCQYVGTGNISRAYNVTTVFSKTKNWLGNMFTTITTVRNARQEILSGATINIQIFDSAGVQRYNFNGTTNATGQNSNSSNYATTPTGTWTANNSIWELENSNNTAFDSSTRNTSTTVAEKAGEDPFLLTCWDCANAQAGDQVFVTAHQRDLDGLAITGSTVYYNVTNMTDGTWQTGTATEIGFGDYEFSFTPQAGRYRIQANVTYLGTNYGYKIDARFKSPGGLTTEQNATLYGINATAQAILTNQTNILNQFPLIPSNVWAYNFIIKQSQIKAI